MMVHTNRRLAVPTSTEIELHTDDAINSRANDVSFGAADARSMAAHARTALAEEAKALRIVRQIERLHSLLSQAPVAINPDITDN